MDGTGWLFRVACLLVQPDHAIDAEAVRVHGITDDFLADSTQQSLARGVPGMEAGR